MRVAVIGGTGFVGRHLVEALVARGHEVVAVARRSPVAFPVPVRSADATRPHGLDEAVADRQAVVWAAGSLRQTIGETFRELHVHGPRHLVQACRAARVRRLIHVSSFGARVSSRSAYHRAKHEGEQLIRHSLLDATVIRPSAVYGQGDEFVTPLARLLKRLPVAPYPGHGEARLAPLAAVDLARAVAAALDDRGTIGEAYDLPGPEILTIGEIYDRVMRAFGLRRPKIGVPYLLIEPMTYLFRAAPLTPFSFDHLAILEEELGEPRALPERCLIADRQPFSVETIRRLFRPPGSPGP